MAIAFYVPAEYGPPPPAQINNNSNNSNQQPGPVPIVDLHQHHHLNQDANNNNVVGQNNQGRAEDNPGGGNNIMGLVTQFGREIMDAFQSTRNNTNSNYNISGANRRGDNHTTHNHHNPQQRQSIQSRRRTAHQDNNHSNPPENNNNTGAVLDLLPLPSLPDIVTCHAGMSIRYGSSHPDSRQELVLPSPETGGSSSHSMTPSPSSSSSSSQLNDQHVVGPQPLSPASLHPPPASMDFEVSLKLTMSRTSEQFPDEVPLLPNVEDEYRLAGMQLRHIADNFQTQRARPGNNQSSFELNVVISVAVPAVAIIGLGLAYLRRNA